MIKSVKKRRKLSIEDVLEKNSYVNILYLIYNANINNKKITLFHLKYVLVKNHGINLDNKQIKQNLDIFFSIPVKKETINYYKMLYKIGEITKKQLKINISKNQINKIKEFGWLNENKKFSTTQNLVNHLTKLKKLGFIKTKKNENKGYPNYELTKYGMQIFKKFFFKFLIERCSKDELDKLIEYYFKVTGN